MLQPLHYQSSGTFLLRGLCLSIFSDISREVSEGKYFPDAISSTTNNFTDPTPSSASWLVTLPVYLGCRIDDSATALVYC